MLLVFNQIENSRNRKQHDIKNLNTIVTYYRTNFILVTFKIGSVHWLIFEKYSTKLKIISKRLFYVS